MEKREKHPTFGKAETISLKSVSLETNNQPSQVLCSAFSFQTSLTTKVIKVQSEAPVSSYVSKGFLQRRSARLAHE